MRPRTLVSSFSSGSRAAKKEDLCQDIRSVFALSSPFAVWRRHSLDSNHPLPPTPKLIKAGRVFDVKSGSYLLNQGILTDGERIKEIGSWEQVQNHAPKDATRIDLSHTTLLPGLTDCHVHLVSSMEGRLSEGGTSSLRLRNRARLCEP
jgi:hypothetical protein